MVCFFHRSVHLNERYAYSIVGAELPCSYVEKLELPSGSPEDVLGYFFAIFWSYLINTFHKHIRPSCSVLDNLIM